MKTAYLKDSKSMFKNNFVRFISIVLIIMLGTAFFIGMNVISPAMEEDAEEYMKDKSVFDISVTSTLGYTEEDIEKFKEIENLDIVKGERTFDALTNFSNDGDIVVKLISNSSDLDINKNDIFEGRNIEKDNECLISSKLKDIYNYQIGDTIKVYRKDDIELSDYLEYSEFKIVGITRSPSYISKFYGNTTLLTGELKGYLMVNDSVLKEENYTSVNIKAKIDSSIKRFSDEYKEKCDEFLEKVEEVNNTIVESKYSDLYKEANDKIIQAENEITKQENDFLAAQNQITDSHLQINSALVDISSMVSAYYNSDEIYSKVLDNSKSLTSLYTNLKELRSKKTQVEKEYTDLSSKTSNAKAEMDEIENNIDKNLYKIYALDNEELKFVELNKENNKLYNEYNKKEEIYKSLDESFKNKTEELKKINDDIKKIDSQTLSLQNDLYINFNSQINLIYGMNNSELITKASYIAESVNALNSNIQSLNDSDVEKKLEEAKQEVNDKKNELHRFKIISEGTPLYENRGFKYLESDLDKMKIMGKIFPVMFFVIAALVTITTVSRMIEEDRKNIGTLKSLGYSKKTILSRYVIYSLLAGLIGGILGILLGSTTITNVMFVSYSSLYDLPDLEFNINIFYSVIALTISLLSTVFVATIITLKELKENTAELMRPKNDASGKSILLEKFTFIWKRFDFLFKVCFRNIFRYKKRLFMTIIGIAGCTALIYAGLGLYFSINNMSEIQFKDIRKLYMEAYFCSDIDSSNIEEIKKHITDQTYIKDATPVCQKTFTIGIDDITKDVFYLSIDPSEATKYISLKNRKSGENIDLSGDGIVITEKLSEIYNLNVGDKIDIIDKDINTSVKIIGIAENYLFNYIYFSPKMYERIYGKEIEYNEMFINVTEELSKDQLENLSEKFKENENIACILLSSEQEEEFQTSLAGLMSIVFLCIGCASILSFTVLINLNNINIEERKRELATIKLLGFYQKELEQYVFRENIILTILGTLVGLVLGIGILGVIIKAAEVETIFLIKDINIISLFIAAIMTITFTLITNLLMKRKIKRIDMIDSLKSVE